MRYKAALVYIAAMIAVHAAMAQAPAIQWQKSLGGSAADWASSIQQTSDGGYIVAGYTESGDGDVSGNHGGKDMWVVKLGSSGNIDWQRSIGGAGEDGAGCIRQTSDGGYIVAGWSSSFDGDIAGDNNGGYDAWIVKLDDTGGITWAKSYGHMPDEYAHSVDQVPGGYVFAGTRAGPLSTFFWMIKITDAGDQVYELLVGGSGDEIAQSIQGTADGGHVFAGYTSSNDGDVTGNNGSTDGWVIKADNAGNGIWVRCYGGTQEDYIYDIKPTPDSGFIMTGMTNSNSGDVSGLHGDFDTWVVKLTSTGDIDWQKCIGGTGYDRASSIQLAPDSGYIIAGFTLSTDGDVDNNSGGYWIIKLTDSGEIDWQKTVGGPNSESGAFSISPTTDGGYVVAGVAGDDGGDITGNHGGYDFWVVKLAPETLGTDRFDDAAAIRVYPNPAAGIVTITGIPIEATIKITDITGKLAHRSVVENEQTTISTESFENGIYLIQTESKGIIHNRKLVIQK